MSEEKDLRTCSRCHTTKLEKYYSINSKGEFYKLCNNCKKNKEDKPTEELFKQLPEFPDIECNAEGIVRWFKSKKPMTIILDKKYDSHYIKYYESLSGEVSNPEGRGKQKSISLFKLVGNLFVDNPNKFKNIGTKDGENSNYRASNLEWVKVRRRKKTNDDD